MMIMAQFGQLQLHLGRFICVALRSDDAECKEKADEIYETLQNMGIEVIYDDRKARPGAMFADADLFRCTCKSCGKSKKSCRKCIEISTRDKSIDKQKTPVDQAVTEVQNIINKLTADINSKLINKTLCAT